MRTVADRAGRLDTAAHAPSRRWGEQLEPLTLVFTAVELSLEVATLPLATLLNGLIDAGLALERVVEPVPDEQQLMRRPDWKDERRRPVFLIVRARKASDARGPGAA